MRRTKFSSHTSSLLWQAVETSEESPTSEKSTPRSFRLMVMTTVTVSHWSPHLCHFAASTSDCPLFRAHLAHLQHCLHRLDHYRQRAERIFAQFDAGDAQLRALFRTEFHLLLLWGRAGATGSTGGPRVYAKFGKVVAAMAAICQDRL